MAAMFAEIIRSISNFVSQAEFIDERGLIEWLSNDLNFKHWQHEDVYFSCLGRLPETAALCGPYGSGIELAQHIARCLTSFEFRRQLPERILSTFPDLSRLFLIHVPRTGGTSLREYIEDKLGIITWNNSYASFDVDVNLTEWRSRDNAPDFKTILELVVRFISQFGKDPDTPFIYSGHITLSNLLARNLIRPVDPCLAVIRDPIELAKSTIAYFFKVMRDHPTRADALHWSNWISQLGGGWVPGDTPSKQLIRNIIWSEKFRLEYGNRIVRSFSEDGSVDRAIDSIKTSKCNIFSVNNSSDISDYINNIFGTQGNFPRLNSAGDIDIFFSKETEEYLLYNVVNLDMKIYEIYNFH